jgi:ankyrin repeat protein
LRDALISAALCYGIDVIPFLLNLGADVNAKTDKGMTPLMAACRGGRYSSKPAIFYEPTVRLLLGAGADINARDNTGRTALSYAEEANVTEIVELLKKTQADRGPQAF